MENTNAQDTPYNANENDTTSAFEGQSFNDAQDSSGELSVDDIILGNVDDTAPAFGTPVTETPEHAQPPHEGAKNDDTRYEYWQSQAAKKENELNELKRQQTQYSQQQQMMQQQQQMQQQQAVQPEEERFPDAPDKPAKPRNFSREEAYSDSSSESARYLDEIDEWRDDMSEYKDLRHQYDMAVVNDSMQKQEQVRQQEIQRAQAYQAQQQQLNHVSEIVQGQYGLSANESVDFIKQMSSTDSLTMDNLVQLWRMKQGQGAPVATPVQASPSPTFQQTKRAQQVPSPMGVMPSAGQQAPGSTEDQIMDKMVKDFNSKNPFK